MSLSISIVFAFDGTSGSYQTENQIATIGTNGSSTSYVVNVTSATINANLVCSTNTCPAIITTGGSGGSGGGGGGGGGAGAPAITSSNIATVSSSEILADTPKLLLLTKTPISEITMTLLNSVYQATVVVEKHDSLPAEIFASPLSTTALIIEFKHDKIDNSNFKEVSFVMDVPKSNDLSFAELGVFRFVDNSWQPVSFTLINENTSSYKLNVTTPGLSYFVVGKKSTSNTLVQTPENVASPTVDLNTQVAEQTSKPASVDTKTNTNSNLKYFIFASALILIIAGGFYTRSILVKKVEKVQNAPISPNATLMKFNNLDQWILKGISSGHSPDELRQRLISAGWKSEQFEEDFNRVLNELNKK